VKTRAVILAGGEGSRLGGLTDKRAKPAVPFAGKYRIIDFTLSNCVNSGIVDVMILTQYRPHSLIEHIGAGRPWDLDRGFTGGIQIYQPYRGRADTDWYKGTADAITQTLSFVERGEPDLILVLSGDHIYKMNYASLADFHVAKQADLTIATLNVTRDEATRMGILATDQEYRVTQFVEKPADPPGTLASMGVYVFSRRTLAQILTDDERRRDSSHDFGKDVIPRMVQAGLRVFAFPFQGYWADVGTIEVYWQTQMDLLKHPPALDLNDRSWIVHTKSEERPPVRIQEGAVIKDSYDHRRLRDRARGARGEKSVLSPGSSSARGRSFALGHPDRRRHRDGRPGRALRHRQDLARVGRNARVAAVPTSAVAPSDGPGVTTVGKMRRSRPESAFPAAPSSPPTRLPVLPPRRHASTVLRKKRERRRNKLRAEGLRRRSRHRPRQPARLRGAGDGMADAGTSARENGFGATLRRDPKWLDSAVVAVLGLFGIYATLRAFEGAYYEWGPYLSPFYSPLIDPKHHLVAALAGAPDSRRAVELPPDLLLLPEGLLPRVLPSILGLRRRQKEGRRYRGETAFSLHPPERAPLLPVPCDHLPRLPLVRRGRAFSFEGHFRVASARWCSSSTSRCSRRTPSPATRCGTSPGRLDCFSCVSFGRARFSAWRGSRP
jgi:glucose-1-phosphate adenylyltransferase